MPLNIARGVRRVRRSGATIAELSLALLLAGSAAAVGAGMLVTAERRVQRDSHDFVSGQTARDVLRLLGADIAAAAWQSVVLRGDSAIDLESHVGVSIACAVSGNAVILPPSRSTLVEPWSVWRYAPEAGDLLTTWDANGATISAVIDSAITTHHGGCVAGGPFRSIADSATAAPLVRLRLASVIALKPGTPVRVFRSVRWMIYRGGDNRWWFGQRRCVSPGVGCGAAQPVAGPLASPADSGLRLERYPDGRVSVVVRGAPADRRAPLFRGAFTIRGAPRVRP